MKGETNVAKEEVGKKLMGMWNIEGMICVVRVIKEGGEKEEWTAGNAGADLYDEQKGLSI